MSTAAIVHSAPLLVAAEPGGARSTHSAVGTIAHATQPCFPAERMSSAWRDSVGRFRDQLCCWSIIMWWRCVARKRRGKRFVITEHVFLSPEWPNVYVVRSFCSASPAVSWLKWNLKPRCWLTRRRLEIDENRRDYHHRVSLQGNDSIPDVRRSRSVHRVGFVRMGKGRCGAVPPSQPIPSTSSDTPSEEDFFVIESAYAIP